VKKMLSQVQLRSDVLWTCLSHALSTEHQEIMGLCLGRLITPSESETIALVERSIVLSRKDKKKDRVEVSYDHLAMASTVAESLSQVDDSETRVIGWYHSHPHITGEPYIRVIGVVRAMSITLY
jgi:BRCA1/BRCA2-containing complex subunit 3